MKTRHIVFPVYVTVLLAWTGFARAQAEPDAAPLGVTESGSTTAEVFEVCALYDETALATARTQQGFALDEDCECERTDQICDTNWRGAEKHVYECTCSRAHCATTTCSLNIATATAGAMEECARTSCTCQGSDLVCGEGLLGTRYEYVCDCP